MLIVSPEIATQEQAGDGEAKPRAKSTGLKVRVGEYVQLDAVRRPCAQPAGVAQTGNGGMVFSFVDIASLF